MAGSSAGCLSRDTVTLTFDLLTPNLDEFIFVPRYSNVVEASMDQWIYQWILKISRKHDGLMHGQKCGNIRAPVCTSYVMEALTSQTKHLQQTDTLLIIEYRIFR